MAQNAHPIQLPAKEVMQMKFDHEAKYWVGIPWNYIEVGRAYRAEDGLRLVLHASPDPVIFLVTEGSVDVKEKCFAQLADGFRGDLIGYVWGESERLSRPVMTNIELGVNIIIGIVGCMSGAGFVFVLSMDVLTFAAEYSDDFPKWYRAIATYLKWRKTLKTHAPVLYDKMVSLALKGAWIGAKEAVGLADDAARIAGPDILANLDDAAAENPRIIGRGAGALVGSVGVKVATKRFSKLGLAWAILYPILSTSLKIAGKAVGRTVVDYQKQAHDLVAALREGDVTITEAEAKQILAEVEKKAPELEQAFKEIKEAFDALK